MTGTLPRPRLRSERHLLLDLGFVLAQVSAFVSGLVIWVASGLTFFGEPLLRDDYLHMTLGFGATTALLLLSTVVALRIGARVWVIIAGIVLAVLSGVLGLLMLLEALERTPVPFDDDPGWWSLAAFVFLPTSWPLLIVCVGSAAMGTRARVRARRG